MTASSDSPVTTGQILAGKYRVERVLGQGGMGIVVAATHLQLGEQVALKFLLKEAATNAEVVQRFLREAQAAVRIKSEHVARVIDVGTLEHGEPFMVMEFLSGRDLSQIIETRGALQSDVAIEYVLQACEAIAEAHALGIVHRDLKPANLFVTKRVDGSHLVKVLDFGISKAALDSNTSGANLTATTGGMMGSPLYMSPEQVRSAKKVDPRADVWSLGVILHELMTGEPPFMAETMQGLLAAIMVDPPVALRQRVPTASAELEAVVLRCLEKDVNRRFASVAELADALAPFAPKARVSVERISRVLRSSPLGATVAASSDPFDGAAPDMAPAPAQAVTPMRAGSRPSLHSDPTMHASDEPRPAQQMETARGWGQTNPDSGVAPPKKANTGLIVGAVVGAVAVLGGGGAFVATRGGAATGAAGTSAVAAAPASAAAPDTAAPAAAPAVAVTPVTSAASPTASAELKPAGKTAPVDVGPAGAKAKPGAKSAAGAAAAAPPVAAPPPAAAAHPPSPPSTPGRGDF